MECQLDVEFVAGIAIELAAEDSGYADVVEQVPRAEAEYSVCVIQCWLVK